MRQGGIIGASGEQKSIHCQHGALKQGQCFLINEWANKAHTHDAEGRFGL